MRFFVGLLFLITCKPTKACMCAAVRALNISPVGAYFGFNYIYAILHIKLGIKDVRVKIFHFFVRLTNNDLLVSEMK